MTDRHDDLRALIRSAAEHGDGSLGGALRELWARAPGAASAGLVLSVRDELRAMGLLNWHLSMRIERSATLEPILPMLRAAALIDGFDIETSIGPFNGYTQSILSERSDLYLTKPDVVILSIELQDISPELASLGSLSRDDRRGAVERVATTLADLIAAFRARSQGALLVHDFIPPSFPSSRIADEGSAGQRHLVAELNARLRATAAEERGVFVIGYADVAARYGKDNWKDSRRWESARVPMNAEPMLMVSREWLRYLYPLAGRTAKVLVSDLDGTLWGGVLGEDGPSGILLSGPQGSPYRATQRALVALENRGIALAVASKNDESDAIAQIRDHPDMVVRPEHLAAWRINWDTKAQQIREIAAELNIATDAVAFLDDNPVERTQVSIALPDVLVIEQAEDVERLPSVLLTHPALERLSLSAEDRSRTEMLRQQRDRRAEAARATTIEDFYISLAQRVSIFAADERDIERVAQLTQKTNQFNVTTKRYAPQQIAAMLSDPAIHVYGVRVQDRFGDNGIVGVMVQRDLADSADIDTLLLSCRVIGRTVESSVLAWLAKNAASRGLTTVEGEVIPTAKNEPARDVYARHGFALVSEKNGTTRWRLELPAALEVPAWIEMTNGE